MTALRTLLLAPVAMLLATTTAEAGFQRATSAEVVRGDYRANVDEWRHQDATPRSLDCPSSRWSTAPIMVVFGGADGTGDISAGFVTLGAKLSRVCIRLVVVEGNTGYDAGARAPGVTSAVGRISDMAANVEYATEVVLNLYPEATRAALLSGSMSAALAAKVVDDYFYRVIATPKPDSLTRDPLTRVDRFVFGGPPIGNLVDGCKHTVDSTVGVLMPQVAAFFTGAPPSSPGGTTGVCANYVAAAARAGVSGAMYGTATPTQLRELQASGVRLNFFVGSEDWFFGRCATCYSGPDGVGNFLQVTGLSALLVMVPPTEINARATVTGTVMPSLGHDPWSPTTSSLVCRLLSADNGEPSDARCDL